MVLAEANRIRLRKMVVVAQVHAAALEVERQVLK